MAQSIAISFRLSDDKHRQLLGVALASGVSPGEYSRELVLAKLDEALLLRQGMEEVGAEVETLKTELTAFRSDFALAVEALLVSNSAGKPVTVEQAKRWVNERLRAKFQPPESP
jgi:hypothetical protein